MRRLLAAVALVSLTSPAVAHEIGVSQAELIEQEGWLYELRVETAAMTPGADPLPAVKEAIAYLCVQWVEEIDRTPLLADLKKWAIR